MYYSNKAITKRIHNIMFELGINQNQLAKLLNITQPAVSKYLKGRIPPPLILLEIAKLSGRSIEWILTGESQIIQTNKTLMEKNQAYQTKKSLTEKIETLPNEIKIHLEAIVDSILGLSQ